MPLLKRDLTAFIDGKERRFAIVRENSKGDVYVTFPAQRAGDDPQGPLLKEQRLSIHPSWRSDSHATIKLQTNYVDGPSPEPVFARTTAPRLVSEARFYPAYVTTLTSLKHPLYDPSAGKQTSGFGEIKPADMAATIALFVGPHLPFNPDGFLNLRSRYFHLLIVMVATNIPTFDFCESAFFATPQIDHRLGIDDMGIAALELMNGLPLSQIDPFAKAVSGRLMQTQVAKMRHIVGEEAITEFETQTAKLAATAALELSGPVRSIVTSSSTRQFGWSLPDEGKQLYAKLQETSPREEFD